MQLKISQGFVQKLKEERLNSKVGFKEEVNLI
jgi:hypothetical protein